MGVGRRGVGAAVAAARALPVPMTMRAARKRCWNKRRAAWVSLKGAWRGGCGRSLALLQNHLEPLAPLSLLNTTPGGQASTVGMLPPSDSEEEEEEGEEGEAKAKAAAAAAAAKAGQTENAGKLPPSESGSGSDDDDDDDEDGSDSSSDAEPEYLRQAPAPRKKCVVGRCVLGWRRGGAARGAAKSKAPSSLHHCSCAQSPGFGTTSVIIT